MGEFYQNGVKQYTWGVNDSMHPDFARRQAMQNQSYAPPVSKPMTFAPPPVPVWPTAPTGIRHVGRSRVAARSSAVERPSSRGGGFLKTLLVLGVVGGVGWWGFQHRAVQWPVAAEPLYRPAIYRLPHGRVGGHYHHHHRHQARQT